MAEPILYLPFSKSPAQVADEAFLRIRTSLPHAQKHLCVSIDSHIWNDRFRQEVHDLLQQRLDDMNALRMRRGYTYQLLAYVRTSVHYPRRLTVWIFRGEDEMTRVKNMLGMVAEENSATG